MRWSKRNRVWRAGVLAGLMFAVCAFSQATPPASQSQPKAAPTQSAPTASTPAPQNPTPPAAQPPASSTPPSTTTPAQTSPAAPAQPAPAPPPKPARIAIVLDPAHGGDERGAALTDKLKEKDVVLSLARRLRAELTRAGATVTMLRDADVTLAPDLRAQLANGSRPALYVSLHASSIGSGVRIYTSIMPEVQPAPGSLVRWQRAQQDWLDASHAAAESIAADLGDRQIVATTLGAPLPPLNSVVAPAIAVEVAPPPGGKASTDMLGSGQFQQRIAAALSAALINARKKVGAPQ
jgi:N-acetylmuramoyl-L-alanine amidase